MSGTEADSSPPSRPDTLLPPAPIPAAASTPAPRQDAPGRAVAGHDVPSVDRDASEPATGRVGDFHREVTERRPYAVRRLEQPFVVEAFEQGIKSVTQGAYGVPRTELAALDDAVDIHCPIRTHTEARDAWVRETAADFRRAIMGRETFHKGGGPAGYLEWLNLGMPTGQWLGMTPQEREAHALEDARRKRAAERARLERRREREEEATPVERISPEQATAELRALGLG